MNFAEEEEKKVEDPARSMSFQGVDQPQIQRATAVPSTKNDSEKKIRIEIHKILSELSEIKRYISSTISKQKFKTLISEQQVFNSEIIQNIIKESYTFPIGKNELKKIKQQIEFSQELQQKLKEFQSLKEGKQSEQIQEKQQQNNIQIVQKNSGQFIYIKFFLAFEIKDKKKTLKADGFNKFLLIVKQNQQNAPDQKIEMLSLNEKILVSKHDFCFNYQNEHDEIQYQYQITDKNTYQSKDKAGNFWIKRKVHDIKHFDCVVFDTPDQFQSGYLFKYENIMNALSLYYELFGDNIGAHIDNFIALQNFQKINNIYYEKRQNDMVQILTKLKTDNTKTPHSFIILSFCDLYYPFSQEILDYWIKQLSPQIFQQFQQEKYYNNFCDGVKKVFQHSKSIHQLDFYYYADYIQQEKNKIFQILELGNKNYSLERLQKILEIHKSQNGYNFSTEELERIYNYYINQFYQTFQDNLIADLLFNSGIFTISIAQIQYFLKNLTDKIKWFTNTQISILKKFYPIIETRIQQQEDVLKELQQHFFQIVQAKLVEKQYPTNRYYSNQYGQKIQILDIRKIKISDYYENDREFVEFLDQKRYLISQQLYDDIYEFSQKPQLIQIINQMISQGIKISPSIVIRSFIRQVEENLNQEQKFHGVSNEQYSIETLFNIVNKEFDILKQKNIDILEKNHLSEAYEGVLKPITDKLDQYSLNQLFTSIQIILEHIYDTIYMQDFKSKQFHDKFLNQIIEKKVKDIVNLNQAIELLQIITTKYIEKFRGCINQYLKSVFEFIQSKIRSLNIDIILDNQQIMQLLKIIIPLKIEIDIPMVQRIVQILSQQLIDKFISGSLNLMDTKTYLIANRQNVDGLFQLFEVDKRSQYTLQQVRDYYKHYDDQQKEIEVWIALHQELHTQNIQEMRNQFQRLYNYKEVTIEQIIASNTQNEGQIQPQNQDLDQKNQQQHFTSFSDYSSQIREIYLLQQCYLFQSVKALQQNIQINQSFQETEALITTMKKITHALVIAMASYKNQNFVNGNELVKTLQLDQIFTQFQGLQQLSLGTIKTYLQCYTKADGKEKYYFDIEQFQFLYLTIYANEQISFSDNLLKDLRGYHQVEVIEQEIRLIMNVFNTMYPSDPHSEKQAFFEPLNQFLQIRSNQNDQTQIEIVIQSYEIVLKHYEEYVNRKHLNAVTSQEHQFLTHLSQSKNILEFIQNQDNDLNQVLEDDDQRNVEVREAAQELIDLRPFLLKVIEHSKNLKIKDFIYQTSTDLRTYLTKDNNILAKMTSINLNIQRIISLSQYQSDRPEQTMKIIENILKSGVYRFAMAGQTNLRAQRLFTAAVEEQQNVAPEQNAQQQQAQPLYQIYEGEELQKFRDKARVFIQVQNQQQQRRQNAQGEQDIEQLQYTKNRKDKVDFFVAHVQKLEQLEEIILSLKESGYLGIQLFDYSFENKKGSLQVINDIDQVLESLKESLTNWEERRQQLMIDYPLLSELSSKVYYQLIIQTFQVIIDQYQGRAIQDFQAAQDSYENLISFFYFCTNNEKVLSIKSQDLFNVIDITQYQQIADQDYTRKLEYLTQRLTHFLEPYAAEVKFSFQLRDLQQQSAVYQLRFKNYEDMIKKLYQINQNQQLYSQQFLLCRQDTSQGEIYSFLMKFLNQAQPKLLLLINLQDLNQINQRYLREKLQECEEKLLLQNQSNRLFLLYLDTDLTLQSILNQQQIPDYELQNALGQKQASMTFTDQPFFQALYKRTLKVYSPASGRGKTYYIQKQIKDQLQAQSISIPVYGTFGKLKFITMMRNFLIKQQGNKRIALHLTIYESNTQISELLFELLFIGILNHNYQQFLVIPNELKIFVEIANSMNDELHKQLSTILNFFDKVKLEDVKGQVDFMEPQIPFNLALYYLAGLGNSSHTYFIDYQESLIYTPFNQTLSLEKCRQVLDEKLFQQFPDDQQCSFYQIQLFIQQFVYLIREINEFDNPFHVQRLIEHMPNNQEINRVRSEFVAQQYQVALQSVKSQSNATIQVLGFENKLQLMVEQAAQVRKFKDLQLDFLSYNEGTLGVFLHDDQKCPQIIKNIYNLENQLLYKNRQVKLPSMNEQNTFLLLKWLVLFIRGKNTTFEDILAEDIESAGIKDVIDKQNLSQISITKENYFKIGLVYLRIQAKLPVILMGETGIGKTSLLVLLSNIMKQDMRILNIHSGVTGEEICQFVLKAQSDIQQSTDKSAKIILFFDEINTNPNISGLLKEVLIERRLDGQPLEDRIVPIAACNPYQLKGEAKTQSSGLTTENIAGIRLERARGLLDLVYSVHPLPESMFQFLWNYDKLERTDEREYIVKILLSANSNQGNIFSKQEIERNVAELVYQSQQFVRDATFEWSVSLRDVKRFSVLLYFFLELLQKKLFISRNCTKSGSQFNVNRQNQNSNELLATHACSTYLNNVHQDQINTIALVLALNCTYLCRFDSYEMREIYIRKMVGILRIQVEEFTYFVDLEYQDFITRLNPPAYIARNWALRENVYLMYVCIMNKIPLFLTGNPGQSKTLSMNLILDGLKLGEQAQDCFFQTLPEIYPRFYQGHLQSTSEKINSVFQAAAKHQDQLSKRQIIDNFSKKYYPKGLSVIIMDEIGLCELSPHNPLKILHSLLEPPQVAFIGISNWALDASKMNRGISLCRPVSSEKELLETAKCIQRQISEKIDHNVDHHFERIVKVYLIYVEELNNDKSLQKIKNFHGLRDFYFTVKQMCRALRKIQKDTILEEEQIFNIASLSLQRNFGGVQIKRDILSIVDEVYQTKAVRLPARELILQNLYEFDIFSRHLMVVTKNIDLALNLVQGKLRADDRDFRTFFGSNFAGDQRDEVLFRVISSIVDCVENGLVCVLLNLDSIYQTFYDLLNQKYQSDNAGKQYCRIAFGTDSRRIFVHPNFKFILIQEQEKLAQLDPPLLNRFEKHIFNFTRSGELQNSLPYDQLLDELEDWVEKINGVNILSENQQGRSKEVNKKSTLLHYTSLENMGALLISAYKQVYDEQQVLTFCKRQILELQSYHAIKLIEYNRSLPQEDVDFAMRCYYGSPEHNSLDAFAKQLRDRQLAGSRELALNVVYTPNNGIVDRRDLINYFNPKIVLLSEINRESELIERTKQFYASAQDNLFVIIFDDIIKFKHDKARVYLVKNIIEQEHADYLKKIGEQTELKFVLIINEMKADFCNNFISFCSNWQQIRIDNLKNIGVYKELEIINLIQNDRTEHILTQENIHKIYLQDELFLIKGLQQVKYQVNADNSNEQPEEQVIQLMSKRQTQLAEVFNQQNPLQTPFKKLFFTLLLKSLEKMLEESGKQPLVQQVISLGYMSNALTLHQAIIDYLRETSLNCFIATVAYMENLNCIDSILSRHVDFQIARLWDILSERYISIDKINEKSENVYIRANNFIFPFVQNLHDEIDAKCGKEQQLIDYTGERPLDFTNKKETLNIQLQVIFDQFNTENQLFINLLSEAQGQDLLLLYIRDAAQYILNTPQKIQAAQFLENIIFSLFPVRTIAQLYSIFYNNKDFLQELWNLFQQLEIECAQLFNGLKQASEDDYYKEYKDSTLEFKIILKVNENIQDYLFPQEQARQINSLLWVQKIKIYLNFMNQNLERYYIGEPEQPLTQFYKKIELLYQFHNLVMQSNIGGPVINIENLQGQLRQVLYQQIKVTISNYNQSQEQQTDSVQEIFQNDQEIEEQQPVTKAIETNQYLLDTGDNIFRAFKQIAGDKANGTPGWINFCFILVKENLKLQSILDNVDIFKESFILIKQILADKKNVKEAQQNFSQFNRILLTGLRNVTFKKYLNYFFSVEETLPELEIVNDILQQLQLDIDDELCCLLTMHIQDELGNYEAEEPEDQDDIQLPESLGELFMQHNLILCLKETNGHAPTQRNIVQRIILLAVWRRVAVTLANFIKEHYATNFEGCKDDVSYQILAQLLNLHDPQNQSFLEGFMIYIIKLIHHDTLSYQPFQQYLQDRTDSYHEIELIPWVKRIGILQKAQNLSVEQAPWKGSSLIKFVDSKNTVEQAIIRNYTQRDVQEWFRLPSQQRLTAFTHFMALYSHFRQNKQFKAAEITFRDNLSRDKGEIFQHPSHQTALQSILYNFENLPNRNYFLDQPQHYRLLHATVLGCAIFSENGLLAELLRNPERILLLNNKFLPFMVQDVLTQQFQHFLDNVDGSGGWRIRCPVCRKIKYFINCIAPHTDQRCSARCNYIFVAKNYTGDPNLLDAASIAKGSIVQENPSMGSQLTVSADIIKENYSNSKATTPLGFRFGNLLVNSTLLMSAIVNNYDIIYLWKLINGLQEDDKAENDPFQFLIQHIDRDWECLKQITGSTTDYQLLFILVESIARLQSTLKHTTVHDQIAQFCFDTIQQRDEYQRIIIQESIEAVVEQKVQLIQQYYATDNYETHSQNQVNIQTLYKETLLETLRLDQPEIEAAAKHLLPNQLRATYDIDQKRIMFLLYQKTQKNEFLILKRLLDERLIFQQQIIQSHAWNIINWYQLILKYLNQKFFAKDIESLNVYDFIDQNYKTEEKTRQILSENYERFKLSWNVLRDYLMAHIGCDIFQIREIEIEREQDSSSILDFYYNLELSQNRIQNQEFQKMLKEIANLQNQQLDEIQKIIKSTISNQDQIKIDAALDFQRDVQLHQAVQQNLIEKADLNDIGFEYYFIKGLSHANGNTVYSDFDGLQNEMKNNFLNKKCRLAVEGSAQMYLKDYQTILSERSIRQLNAKIPQQNELLVEDINQVLTILQYQVDQEVSKLYYELLQCFNLVKMIGGRTDTTLLNFFVNRMKITNQTPEIKDVLNFISLNQLYEFLKLIEKRQLTLLADKCLQRYSDVFGQQREYYIQIIKHQLRERKVSNKDFRLVLGRFIVRNLSSVNCGIGLTNYVFSALQFVPGIWEDVTDAFALDLQDQNGQPINDIPINFTKSVFDWVNTECTLAQEQEEMRKRQELNKVQQQQQSQHNIMNNFDDNLKVPTVAPQTQKIAEMFKQKQQKTNEAKKEVDQGTKKTNKNLKKI